MIKTIKSNENITYDIKELVCDIPEDISLIPQNVGWGSTCIVISTAEVYIKNSNGEWVKL